MSLELKYTFKVLCPEVGHGSKDYDLTIMLVVFMETVLNINAVVHMHDAHMT